MDILMPLLLWAAQAQAAYAQQTVSAMGIMVLSHNTATLLL
jgi:hypothetical protein